MSFISSGIGGAKVQAGFANRVFELFHAFARNSIMWMVPYVDAGQALHYLYVLYDVDVPEIDEPVVHTVIDHEDAGCRGQLLQKGLEVVSRDGTVVDAVFCIQRVLFFLFSAYEATGGQWNLGWHSCPHHWSSLVHQPGWHSFGVRDAGYSHVYVMLISNHILLHRTKKVPPGTCMRQQ